MVLSQLNLKTLSLWWAVFLSALVPLGYLFYQSLTFGLGADPAKEIVDFLGLWALHFLWISLAITPLTRVLKWNAPMRFRRMIGLYAFFYAMLHLLAVSTFIFGWRWNLLLREVSERPYVIVGTLALVLLIPLAVTSTKNWQRKLGRRWKSLHQLVYPASILVLVHLIWLIRASYFDAILYGSILAALLGYRLWKSSERTLARRSRAVRQPVAKTSE